jgi:hypothetical protein
MNTIGKRRLPAGWQKLGSLVRSEIEFLGQKIDGITNAKFAGGRSFEHGKHKGLIIRNSHALSLVAAVRRAKGSLRYRVTTFAGDCSPRRPARIQPPRIST